MVTMAMFVEEVLVAGHAPGSGGGGVDASGGSGAWTWWGHERRNQESIAHFWI